MGSGKIKITCLQQIAVGGTAVLHLAEQPDGRRLVLRELLPRLRWKWHMHRRFLNGAQIREAVSPHPNIVFSVEYGYKRLVPYEIIEYVRGGTLYEMISRKDPLIKEQSFEILRQACCAISHVHEKGYIHLDVKPENFLVDRSGGTLCVKLTDFDLSRRMGDVSDAYRSGTATYMAPEQIRRGAIGIESDIFAFGVLAYYLVTGQKPFSGFTFEEMQRQQLSSSFQVVEPVKVAPDITPKLNWMIMKCLEKDTAKRFPNMQYLQKEMGRI